MWKVIDRNQQAVDADAGPLLNDEIKDKIRSFFPRYETKRAALLPALHVVQEAFGHISHQAMVEIAEVLEIAPAEVMDVVSFYTHYWSHPRGKKTIVLCRSLSCELMGGKAVLEQIKSTLNVEDHGTTADGQYSLMTEECLAGCDYAPCMLINERMHKLVKPDDVQAILNDPDNDTVPMPRSDLFDPPQVDDGLRQTSDIDEMKEAD